MISKLSIQYNLLVILTVSLLSFTQAHAHAVVTHTSLSVSKITPNKKNQLHLTFNSKIELGLSQIFLVSSGDKMQWVKVVHGSNPGEIIIDIPPLSPGEYALKLSIFAADGHLSEDLVRFFVTENIE